MQRSRRLSVDAPYLQKFGASHGFLLKNRLQLQLCQSPSDLEVFIVSRSGSTDECSDFLSSMRSFLPNQTGTSWPARACPGCQQIFRAEEVPVADCDVEIELDAPSSFDFSNDLAGKQAPLQPAKKKNALMETASIPDDASAFDFDLDDDSSTPPKKKVGSERRVKPVEEKKPRVKPSTPETKFAFDDTPSPSPSPFVFDGDAVASSVKQSDRRPEPKNASITIRPPIFLACKISTTRRQLRRPRRNSRKRSRLAVIFICGNRGSLAKPVFFAYSSRLMNWYS